MFQQVLPFINQKTGLNWIDLICIGFILFYAIEGYFVGFINALFNVIKFILSFIIGLKFYLVVANLLLRFLTIPQGFVYALSFFLTTFVAEIILHFLLRGLFIFVTKKILYQKKIYRTINHILGIFPGILSAFVLITFLLTVIVTLPVSPFLKKSVLDGKIGGNLVARSQSLEKDIGGVFQGAAKDTLNFLTVEPHSDQVVNFNFRTHNYSVDTAAENRMLQMVNTERAKDGKSPLTMNAPLQKVARGHAADMLERGYFSHYTPEGLSPFDRMSRDSIIYNSAGENLAFSPNVDLAMQGLMNSPGHKANILSPDFHQVGIGVLDAGVYGEMFVQEFTD